MSSDAATLRAGELVAGRFRVIRLLGIGGMGAVYEVEHEHTKHRRALKLLHRSCVELPEVVGRFMREASAAGRIGSRHIVETFDAGQLPGGEPYLVMELLRGQTLADLLEKEGRLGVGLALEIVRQSAIGIHAAHAAGIVHRDLKPENLFLMEGPEPQVKILDFGISKFDPELTGTPSLTTDGTTLGTPYYMSPEQVRGGAPVDGQADVYALGVVLYECLTGKPPFHAETLPALCVLIHEGKYEAPSALRPDVSADVQNVIAKAMERSTDRRYATAQDLADALAQLISGQAVSLGDTLAVPSGATPTLRRPSAEARSIAPPAAEGTDLATRTQLSRDVQHADARSRRAVWLLGGVAVAALLGFLLWKASSTRTTSPALEPVAAVTAPSPTTSVAPLASSEVEPPEPDAAASAAPRPTQARPSPSKPQPQNTRAKEHGLGTEDPF